MGAIRPGTFYTLPTELQAQILSLVDSPEHLKTLSSCSRHLKELILPLLFSKIEFGPLLRNESIQYFAEHCSPKYGRYCRDLRLGFSFGPLLNAEYEEQRGILFARVLGNTSKTIQKLVFDTAGSSLESCAPTLKAMQLTSFPALRSLDLRYYNPEQDEVAILADVFEGMAKDSALMPQLKHMALQGKWSLSSSVEGQTDVDISPIFRNLGLLLKTKASLTNLCLSYSGLRAPELHCLFREAQYLQQLTLKKLEYFSLQNCFEILIDTPLQANLQVLNLNLDYALIPAGHLQLPDRKEYVFPELKRLAVSLDLGHNATGTSDLAAFRLYGSLFRCQQLIYPSLEIIDMANAISFSLGSARALASHVLINRRLCMPSLRVLICADATPSTNVESIAPLLQKCGISVQIGYEGALPEGVEGSQVNHHGSEDTAMHVDNPIDAASATERSENL